MKMIWGFTGREATEEDVLACVGPGWSQLLKDLMADLESLGWDGTIMQVKEKFGGLRFYIGSATDVVWKRIKEAEAKSYDICEACSKDGSIRKEGWWKTRCDECQKVFQERYTSKF
jgi:hypothetical protein